MARKKQDYPADFLAFYQAYPKERHQGYVAPFKSWSSLEKKGELPELSVILKAIEEQKTTRGWLNGYIPMMTTWLNQKRWEAEVQDNSLAKEQAANSKRLQRFAIHRKKRTFIVSWRGWRQESNFIGIHVVELVHLAGLVLPGLRQRRCRHSGCFQITCFTFPASPYQPMIWRRGSS